MSLLDEQLYKEKYLKYKIKYIKLKDYQGGADFEEAYIFANKYDLSRINHVSIMNINDLKSILNKKGYIIYKSSPAKIKLINISNALTKMKNNQIKSFNKKINTSSNNLKNKVANLTLSDQINNINSLINSIKKNVYLIINNNNNNDDDKNIKHVTNNINLTELNENIKKIIDYENKNINIIKEINTLILNNDKSKTILDRNVDTSSILNDTITNKQNIDFNNNNNNNFELIKQIVFDELTKIDNKIVNNYDINYIHIKFISNYNKNVKITYFS
jgi:hypothetical protein